jgi:hypothetical protein
LNRRATSPSTPPASAVTSEPAVCSTKTEPTYPEAVGNRASFLADRRIPTVRATSREHVEIGIYGFFTRPYRCIVL